MHVIETPSSRLGLEVFADPASVAVVGASADRAKWGYWLASGALAGKHRRNVYLVNSRVDQVLGERCAASLFDLPEVPDLVALCVPAAHVPAVVDAGLQLGVRGFLGVTAGVEDEQALAGRITARGARLVGANSLGIYDAASELQLLWGTMKPGPLAIVSQSGQLGSELAELANRHGIGISRFVSIGNQSDVTAAELLADLAGHDATEVIAVYLEGFTDATALFDTLRTLAEAGKPTVLLTVGASSGGARIARSHTGSLTSAVDIIDAACRKAGVVRARTPGEVIDIARTYLAAPRPCGRRVAIIGDSGGQCGIAADVAAGLGLDVPQFSAEVCADLAQRLPSGAATANPVDLAGAGEADLHTYATLAENLIGTGEIDAVVLTGYFGCYARDVPALATIESTVIGRLGDAVRRTGIPVVVHTMGAESDAADIMWRHGIPAYDRIESALLALSAAATGPIAAPTAVPPAYSACRPVRPGYWAAREALAEIGVSFPPAVMVRTAAEAEAAITTLTLPVVLKAGWFDHKSEVGGVVIGIADRTELLAAFDAMYSRLGDGEYVIEEQDRRRDTVEILVGARRDAAFGPVVVVGAGGTEAEMHQDVRVELAPVSVDTARAMLDGLRCAPLLRGWRGRPATDVATLAELVARVSEYIAVRGDVDEIELNPLRVAADGVVAVDALLTAKPSEQDPALDQS